MRASGTSGTALLVTVVAVVIVWETAWGQTAGPGGAAYTREYEPWYAVEVVPKDEMQKLRAEDRKLESEVQAVLREYARAEEESRREELRRKLSESLQQQFEIRQQMRDREIAALEEQIKRLRDVFEKRAAAKQRIVEARLDQLIRGAEGLGWDGNVGGAPNDATILTPVPGGAPLLRSSRR